MHQYSYNKGIVYWLLSGAILILTMVIIGGITRLTGSGLSIVEWNLISGTLPPLNEEAWTAVFEKYKLFPEYQKLNKGMTLPEFKQIFFWEYLHRLLGRVIGFIFILPFLYFLLKKQLTTWLFRRLLLILALGMAQGLLGWFMVKSGLVENPHVSHYRLAAHLAMALALIGVILWTVADLITRKQLRVQFQPSNLNRLAVLALAIILIQIILGAFVAGLKAGFSYNTYPLMGNEFFPKHLAGIGWIEVMENGALMQFAHRWVAVLVILAVLILWRRIYTLHEKRSVYILAWLMVFTCLVQIALGITTLLLAVPVSLGVLHQVVAVLLFSQALLLVHQLNYNATR